MAVSSLSNSEGERLRACRSGGEAEGGDVNGVAV